jgi:hypothetical protein
MFGKTNYVRNRELEFSLKDISKSELVKIEETIDVVNEGLDLVSNEELKMDFPLLVLGKNLH